MGTENDELVSWLRLNFCSGLGSITQRALLGALGPPEQIFAASHAAIAAVTGELLAKKLLMPADNARIDAALHWAQQEDNHILSLVDPAYPPALLNSADPPVLLYAKGQLEHLSQPALAIVGARSATPQGLANAEAFAHSLGNAGWVIVSGMALGIDTAAHQGALQSNAATIAVLGTGADRVYPASNRDLAHKIASKGVLISEFALGSPPQAYHFPRRNRLIAALARGVLVVEASTNSGSLITARLAGESGREVFAIPGSIHSPLSHGCHHLIRQGAKLVETCQDILEELAWDPASPKHSSTSVAHCEASTPQHSPKGDPAPEYAVNSKLVLDALGHDPVDIDTLAAWSGLTLDVLYVILLALEIQGRIGRLPGGRYQRL